MPLLVNVFNGAQGTPAPLEPDDILFHLGSRLVTLHQSVLRRWIRPGQQLQGRVSGCGGSCCQGKDESSTERSLATPLCLLGKTKCVFRENWFSFPWGKYMRNFFWV